MSLFLGVDVVEFGLGILDHLILLIQYCNLIQVKFHQLKQAHTNLYLRNVDSLDLEKSILRVASRN